VKCPKCGYLGFDSGDRCRNCGYDFSLVNRSSTPADLPLFRGDMPVLPPPRAPLAVRRATPAPARIRPRTPAPTPEAPPLLGGALDDGARPREGVAHPPSPVESPGLLDDERPSAPAGSRAAAAAIDSGLIALVDVVVLHFTLALCGLTFADLRILPLLPMAGFLLFLNLGYIVLFTGTLGQTLGKMAMAIEVVPERRQKMNLPRATLRAGAIVLSLLPAGLGWLAGLVGDGRGLHDRLAGTRVVRVAGA
jgi:uncharacterized RDD family membrane protein YckC